MTEPPEQELRPSVARRALAIALLALRVAIVLAVIALNLRLYDDLASTYVPGDVGEDALEQLASLEAALADGGAERMQAHFPEGYFFTYALFGLASMDVASLLPEDDPDREERLADARMALAALQSDAG